MGVKNGLVVDHKSQEKLDNRRSNLQCVTVSQNCFNKKSHSGIFKYKGIYRSGNRFAAQITVQGLKKYLGTFVCEQDAALAYDTALKEAYPNAPTTSFNF